MYLQKYAKSCLSSKFGDFVERRLFRGPSSWPESRLWTAGRRGGLSRQRESTEPAELEPQGQTSARKHFYCTLPHQARHVPSSDCTLPHTRIPEEGSLSRTSITASQNHPLLLLAMSRSPRPDYSHGQSQGSGSMRNSQCSRRVR